ncbi:MAG: hypothetical protein AAF950_15845 [Pseudomonadota bacterium]
MPDLEPARIEIVEALGCLEDAHLAAMPGQAPRSTRDEIEDAIGSARPLIAKALAYLDKAEKLISE